MFGWKELEMRIHIRDVTNEIYERISNLEKHLNIKYDYYHKNYNSINKCESCGHKLEKK